MISGLQVGETIDVPGDKITDAIRKLWDQGLFEDVSITCVNKIGKKIFLNIDLKERPRISKFSFKGVKKSEAEELRKKINLTRGDVATEHTYTKTTRIIEDYYFEKGIRLEGGWQLVFEKQINKNWYYFNEDGSCDKTLKPVDGFYTDRNGYAYSQNGEGLAGLQTIDGKKYYFDSKGYALKNGTYASHLFLDDYAAYTGLYEKDNVLYYYQDGRTATCGLFYIDGDYYYSYWGGVVKTSGQYYVSRTYCDLPVGTYEFAEDGKMLNGIIEKNGVNYLYIEGKPAKYGLYNIDDDYYFA